MSVATKSEEVAAAVGPRTSLYRIGVEFAAALAGTLWNRLYLPTKAMFDLLCAPIRWTDSIVSDYGETNRIAAGFFAIARKPPAPP